MTPAAAAAALSRVQAASCAREARCQSRAGYLADACAAQDGAYVSLAGIGFFLQHGAADALAQGNVLLDAAALDDCLALVAASPCTERTNGALAPARAAAAICGRALRGTLDGGAVCSGDLECRSRSCVEGPGCGGTCANVAGPSEPCGGASGTVCDPLLPLLCIDGTCRPPQAAGGACGSSADCSAGLACVVSCAAGRCAGACQTPLAASQPCSVDDVCAEGLSCGGSPSICRAPLDAAAPCGEGDNCAAGLVCRGEGGGFDASGTCAVASAEGGPCVSGTAVLVTGCLQGLACSGGACVRLPGSGVCDPEVGCDGTRSRCSGGTCHPLQQIGGACATAEDCYSQICTAGACAQPPCGVHQPRSR